MKQAVEIENKHLFSKSDLKKLLIPLMIEQLLNSMMGMVDTVMVSNVGSAAMQKEVIMRQGRYYCQRW